jgi:hypothetical protein
VLRECIMQRVVHMDRLLDVEGRHVQGSADKIGEICFCLLQGLQASLRATIAASLASTAPALGRSMANCLLHGLPNTPGASAGTTAGAGVLQMLLNSVSTADPAMADCALSILLQASGASAAMLLAYQGAARTVLEQLEHLEAAQARSACQIFARMLVHEGASTDDVVDADAFPFTAVVQQYLSTALGSSGAARIRVGIVGSLEWQRALAQAGAEQAEHAKNMLEALLGQVSRQPELLAFACDAMAQMFLELLRSPEPLAQVRALML